MKDCDFENISTDEKEELNIEPQVHLSSCLKAFNMLEPHTIDDMEKIFNEYMITPDSFGAKPFDVMKDTNLVVKIGPRYFESQIGVAMIMSYIVFKRPLDPSQIGKCLNEQFLGANWDQPAKPQS